MSISGYKQISIRNIVFSWLIASAMLSPSAFSATVFGDFDAAYQLWTASSSGAIFSYNTTTNVFTATSPYHNNPLIDNNADGFPASHIAEDLNGEFSLQATIDETDTLSDGIFSLVISSPTLGITDPVTVFSGNLVSFFNLDPIHYEGF